MTMISEENRLNFQCSDAGLLCGFVCFLIFFVITGEGVHMEAVLFSLE